MLWDANAYWCGIHGMHDVGPCRRCDEIHRNAMAVDDGMRLCQKHGGYHVVYGCEGCRRDIIVEFQKTLRQANNRAAAVKAEIAERAVMWEMKL